MAVRTSKKPDDAVINGNGTLVLQLISSSGLYGAEQVVLQLSLQLQRLEIKNVIGIVAAGNQPLPALKKQAERCRLITATFLTRGKLDWRCISGIAAYCKSNHITLIHAHGYKASIMAMFLCFFYRLPYIITCHLWYPDDFKVRLYNHLQNITMFFAERVVGVSTAIIRDIARTGVSKNKLLVIENGIELNGHYATNELNKAGLRKELGLRADSMLIGTLGRLVAQKDHATLIKSAVQVCRLMDNVEFIVAGDGELYTDLVRLSVIEGIKDRFHFVGYYDHQYKLLRLLDIFVLTSLDEGLPMALLEAMAMKRPVVTTAVGGMAGIIRNGHNGLFVEKGNSPQLADALVLLLKDSPYRLSLADNAYSTVMSRFRSEIMAKKYLELYHNVLSKL
jgi:glycosyltransferase involved in cell wall biosynthesis